MHTLWPNVATATPWGDANHPTGPPHPPLALWLGRDRPDPPPIVNRHPGGPWSTGNTGPRHGRFYARVKKTETCAGDISPVVRAQT
jgi:hypothetical protein